MADIVYTWAQKYITGNCPSDEHRQKYKLDKYDLYMGEYAWQEEALDDIFSKFNKNENYDEVFYKCRMLDKFYSTNLKEALYSTSKNNIVYNILNVNINGDNFDTLVKDKDNAVDLIESIKNTVSNKYETKEVLSFVSKYCNRHNENAFPIYDKYVRQMLYCINKIYPFYKKDGEKANFTIYENSKCDTILKDYRKFKEVIDCFNEEFFKSKLNYKQLDLYLWLWAKELLRFNKSSLIKGE